MEASTVATPEAPAKPAEAERSTNELFRWSDYVHVGNGATECEHGIDGECKDPEHFHAWVCMPNVYQIRDIVDKARAAKARKTRALRDSESDSYVTLEADLDELRGDHFGELIEAIGRRHVEKRLHEIIARVRDDDRFEHQAQDAEEFQRQIALPEDERDEEGFERLQQDMTAYADALQKEIDGDVAAEEESLRRRPPDEVIDIERQFRIDDLGWEAYNHTFYTWCMYVGTRVPTTTGFPSVRKFKTPDDQRNAAPEVLTVLRDKVRALENQTTTSRSDAAGN